MLSKKIFKFWKDNFGIVIVLLLAVGLRLYRLKELTTFAGDQGIDLLIVKKIIVNHVWTLLGPKTSMLPIYNGPIYYYMILPILYVFKLDPMSVSYFMVFLWLGAFYFTYMLAKKMFGKRAGLLSALFFSIWPLSIEYSRESFNSFPTPFFAALFLLGIWYYLNSLGTKQRQLAIFISGLCFGVMMQLHYFNFFLGLVIFFDLLIKKKLSLKSFSFFIFAFLIGFSPMIFFENRHNFFNTRTLLIALREGGLNAFHFQVHYLIAFFPVAFISLAYLVDRIWRKNNYLGILTTIVLIFINLMNVDLSRNHGFTMPDGWNYLGVKKASEIIAKDASNGFNIAAILDGDTRAYPYRYLIEVFGKKPMDVISYGHSSTLYVVARGDEQYVVNYPVWEIQSFLPAKVEKIWEIQEGYRVFKLIKVEKK